MNNRDGVAASFSFSLSSLNSGIAPTLVRDRTRGDLKKDVHGRAHGHPDSVKELRWTTSG
jgi:hypothetical protein